MIRQICNVRPQDIVTTRSNDLLVRLGIEDLDLILKERRLRWYGHVVRSSGAIKTAFDIQVDGKRGPGRPKMTWKQLTERDCREWKLSAINPHDRRTWGSGVRSAMRSASQLFGRGPTDVNQKSDYIYIKKQLKSFWSEIQDDCHGGHLETLFFTSSPEPKGQLTPTCWEALGWLVGKKIAKIVPIGNPRWLPWKFFSLLLLNPETNWLQTW